MTRPRKPTPEPLADGVSCVAIAGLGLLGGSLGLALRKSAVGVRVLGYARRAETVEQALGNGLDEFINDWLRANPKE